jgi:hypothetical protein
MESEKSESLLKVPGQKIFQSSFSLKMHMPDPFPGQIIKIPPTEPDRFFRPSINGLDLCDFQSLYVPRNMNLDLRHLYKLFELQPEPKKLLEETRTDSHQKNKWFMDDLDTKSKIGPIFNGVGDDEDYDLILQYSGKNTFKDHLIRKPQSSTGMKKKEVSQKNENTRTLEEKIKVKSKVG